MSVDQLPRQLREFANYLDGFLERLRQDGGWCGIFWRRDPEGMRACLDGLEVPPWDVMEALLQDLAAAYGPAAATAERERALSLHTAAVAAFDALPGARDALGDHLDAMLRAQRYAVERQAQLALLLAAASTREEADALRVDIAWAHDDHDRATARCTALRARLAALDRPAAPEDDGGPTGAEPPGTTGGHPAPRHPRPAGPAAPATGPTPGPEGFGRPASGTHEPPTPGAEQALRPTDRHPTTSDASAPATVFAPGPAGSGASVSGVPGAAESGAGWAPRFTDRSGGPASIPGPARSDAAGPVAPATVFAPGPAGSGASVSGVPGAADPGAGWAPRFTDRSGGPASVPGAAVPDAAGRAAPEVGHAAPGVVLGPDPSASGVPGSMASGDAQASWFAERTGAPAPRPGPSAVLGGTAAGADAGRRLPSPAGGESSAPGGKARKRRRGSARFAGMVEDEGGAVVVPQASGGAPGQGRGARFAGAGEQGETGALAREPASEVDPAAGAAVAATVRALARLRAEGRSGEAHALLAECAHWPATRLPLLADALEPAGLGADWGTLLWEAASLPAEPLVAAAEALTAAGRPTDGRQLLRQGVVRPAAEIGAAVLGLDTQGRGREVLALLDAYVRVRPPQEAARSAAADPSRLVPLLLRAARGVSEEREWDLVHALRVAGLTA
ncbi:hypothetical protein [Streptomyces collinus]|uniref:hypothetical protein n=1 Tax=Streptomyces collinus TaxID=42684 RepID=UPI003414AE6F